MKQLFKTVMVALCAILFTSQAQAQSLKDILSSGTLSKVVSAVTGTSSSVDLVGTWSYTGSAVEFESSNLLKKAGGTVASSALQSKIDTQLSKVGIKSGKMSFTFKNDSTFTSTVGSRTKSGTYSYNASTQKLQLKYGVLTTISADLEYSSSSIELLFESDKLLSIISAISSSSSNSTLSTLGSLAGSYDGMKTGLKFSKK
jgi:hypothetical protein